MPDSDRRVRINAYKYLLLNACGKLSLFSLFRSDRAGSEGGRRGVRGGAEADDKKLEEGRD